jgi:hypothetical protein
LGLHPSGFDAREGVFVQYLTISTTMCAFENVCE